MVSRIPVPSTVQKAKPKMVGPLPALPLGTTTWEVNRGELVLDFREAPRHLSRGGEVQSEM